MTRTLMTRLLLVIALMATGATAMYVYLRPGLVSTTTPASSPGGEQATLPAAPAGDEMLTLTPDAIARAGIEVAEVALSRPGGTLRLPGVVEPDGYRTVDVTPIVGGTVMSMTVGLGDHVEPGMTVARLRSPELTDEVRRWLTERAALDVTTRQATRVKQLAEVGAASQQEREAAESDLVRATTQLETTRARLLRLGLNDAALATIAAGGGLPEVIEVAAQAGGVVLRRPVNPGQNVGPSDTLVTLADLSAVWIMTDVFERDVAQVRVGSPVTVSTAAFPGRTWAGRVTYIDPEVMRETRTVRARVEVPNTGRQLRFGMFVSVDVNRTGDESMVVVPASAVQTLGEASVLYVEMPGQSGRFMERVVETTRAGAEGVGITSGVAAGERVVVAGSFFLRAERERLGWPAPVAPMAARTEAMPMAGAPAPSPVVRRVVEITAAGLVPSRVSVPARQPVDLVFVRRVEETCGTEVLIPGLDVRRELPLNEEVVIRIPPRDPGELTFSCGMDMLRGVLVIGGV